MATPFGVNETAELVLDLLSRTTLVTPDVLALVRGRTAGGTPVTQALVEERVATADGVSRMLAARHHLALVDLPGSVSPWTRPSSSPFRLWSAQLRCRMHWKATC